MDDTAEYECQAKGHEGSSRTFTDGSPEYYLRKYGYATPPKNCKPCRKWANSQKDENKLCACGSKFRIPAKLKISIFKKEGPYIPFTECLPCREGNRPEKSIKDRPDREKRRQQKIKELQSDFDNLPHGLAIEARHIAYDTSYYERIIPNHKVRIPNVTWQEQRWEHLMHHVPGSEYDWTHPSAKRELNLRGDTSPTSFVGFNASFGELFDSVKSQLQQTSDKHVREYTTDDTERLVRVTFSGDHEGLEVTIIDIQRDGTYAVATTYDNVSVSYVKDNFVV